MLHRSGPAVLLLLAIGCGGGGGGASPPDAAPAYPVAFIEDACPPNASQWTVRCGRVSVPESRAAPGGNHVDLFVVQVKSPSLTVMPDPVLYVEGGPGEAGTDTIFALAQIDPGPLTALVAHRDLIAIDQRGTGRSIPSLQCPELVNQPLSMMGATMTMAGMVPSAPLAKCRERLVGQGIDLARYDTAAAADDLEDVRRALGVAQWNALGASYGTRLALELVRRHPAGLRSVTLDSVWPPDVDAIAEAGPNFMRAFELLFTACAAQPACAHAYPQLRQVFLDVIAALDASPVPVMTPNGTVMITGRILAAGVTRLLYAPLYVRELPEIFFQLHDGNYDFIQKAFGGGTSSMAAASALSFGLHYSVMCADAFPYTSAAKVDMLAAGLPAELRAALTFRSYLDLCPVWNVPPSPAALAQPVRSPLPALVLSGQIDPVTPPAWGERAAAALSASFRFELRGEGHGEFITQCGNDVLHRFLDADGTAPDAPCLAAERDVQVAIHR